MKRGLKLGKCKHCGVLIHSETAILRVCCDRCKKVPLVNGYNHLPKFLRLAYLRATNNHCQVCKKQFEDNQLEIHRIIRGNQGGKYTVAKLNSKENNVMVVCNFCHRSIHSKEFTT
jgi:5-methylcytosine-specific restriction endonuclease McrA